MAAGVRVYCVLHSGSGISVIAVLETVDAIRVVGEDGFRLELSQGMNYFTEKRPVCLKLAVRVIEHYDIASADGIGRQPFVRPLESPQSVPMSLPGRCCHRFL